MTPVLIDTHAWAWSMTDDARLSPVAIAAMTMADAVFISSVSLFEIGQKVRIGKWSEMEPHLDDLIDIASEQGAHFISATPEIALLAAVLPWPHRDPFDRFIAATSISEGLPLVSADTVFDELQNQPKWQGRIW